MTYSNPLFVNSPTDVSLGVGSPAIKTGVNLSSLFTDDYTGATRVTPWDRGAYASEYAATDPEPEPDPENTYYVSTSGTDGSSVNGSLTTPWRTIRYGMTRMGRSDTLILRGGTYDESGHISASHLKSGLSPTNPTIIQSYPGERAIYRPPWHSNTNDLIAAVDGGTSIYHSNIVFRGWTIDRSRRLQSGFYARGAHMRLYGKNWVLDNMHFVNAPNDSGVQFWAPVGSAIQNYSSNIVVSSCLFSNWNSFTAVAAEGHALYSYQIDDFTVEDCLFTVGRASAIQISSTAEGNGARNVTIRRNSFTRTPGNDTHWRVGIYCNGAQTNTFIYNNVLEGFQDNGDSRGVVYMSLLGRDVYAWNNTIYAHTDNNAYGLTIRSANCIAVNNIIWGTFGNRESIFNEKDFSVAYLTNNIAGPKIPNLSAGTSYQSGNLWGPDNDPKFLNAPTDLSIDTDSPAAGTGINLSFAFTDDYYNKDRQQWDRGAIALGSDSGGGGGEEEEPPPPPPILYPLISVSRSGDAFEQGQQSNTFIIKSSVYYESDLNIVFEMSGTAVSNVNYTLSSESPITIPAGQNSVTLTLTPIDNQTIGTRDAVITIQPDTGYTLSSVDTATIVIYGSGVAESGFRRTFGGAAARFRTMR